MRLAALFTAVAGLAVAGGSVYFARDYLAIDLAETQASQEDKTVSVIVASRDIKFGEAVQGPCFRDLNWERFRPQ